MFITDLVVIGKVVLILEPGGRKLGTAYETV